MIGKQAVPAEISSTMQGLFATLPLWPLLAAIGIGLLLATKQGLRYAHWLTVGGVGISATLAVLLYLNVAPLAAKHAQHGDHADHAAGSGVTAQLVADTPAADEHTSDEHADSSHATESHLGERAHTDGDHGTTYAIDTYTIAHWFSLGQFTDTDGQIYTRWVDFNFAVDGLTVTMLLFVCVVSLMVVIYAVGYMKDHHGHPEVGYQRFFAWLGLFVFSMLMLVLSGNFVLLYLGWEAVGLCSYLLIGFYYKKPEAAAAAKKAFIVNRIGDFGFALGIFTIYMVLKDHVQPGENVLDYATVFKYAGVIASQEIAGINAASLISLLLFCGAIGKSAQFPLYVWLPDAMEGPTPVSALIHAATMVTAGVYLVCLLSPIYEYAPVAAGFVTVIGAVTALYAATVGMAQNDIKRVIAYSTCSQLGYMFFAAGIGAYQAAMFHLFTHAFFKALLFLGAGSVIHGMHHEQDMRKMGGVAKYMKITYAAMLIGTIAIIGLGIPHTQLGFAGFFSKDAIIETSFAAGIKGVSFAQLAFWFGIVAALLTSFYSWRLIYMTFHGPMAEPDHHDAHEDDHDHHHHGGEPHESPWTMLVPLIVLSTGAILAGFLFYGSFVGHHQKEFWDGAIYAAADNTVLKDKYPHHDGGIVPEWVFWTPLFVTVLGFLIATFTYFFNRGFGARLAAKGGPLHSLFANKWYFDEIYQATFIRWTRVLGDFFWKVGDKKIIDVLGPDGLTKLARWSAGRLSAMHTGYLYHYAFVILGAAAVFGAVALINMTGAN